MTQRLTLSLLCLSLVACGGSSSGDGSFNPVIDFERDFPLATGDGPIATEAADINQDGLADIVVINNVQSTITVYLNNTPANNGNALFPFRFDFPGGANPSRLAIADINLDGRPDIIHTSSSDDQLNISLNTTTPGSNTVSLSTLFSADVGTNPQGLAVGDFNGDGQLDIAVANSGDDTISVFINTTPTNAAVPSLGARVDMACGVQPLGIAAGDFNQDGFDDLATANFSDDSTSVFINNSAQNAVVANLLAQQVFFCGAGPFDVAIADLNRDGFPEIATVNVGDDTVGILLNDTIGGSIFAEFPVLQSSILGIDPDSVLLRDIDRDGITDIVVSHQNSQNVAVLLNNTFPDPNGALVGVSVFQVANLQTNGGALDVTSGDFDNDGGIDLAVTNFAVDNLALFYSR